MGRLRIRILNLYRPEHEACLSELVDELATLGHAERGVASYYWNVRRFLCWLENQGAKRVEATTAMDLEAYREHVRNAPSLRDGGPVSEKTIYSLLRSVQLLFDYLLQRGEITADPFSTFTMNRPKRGPARAILTRLEVEELYAACENIAERALLGLTYGCGLRVGELERLNADDVQLGKGVLVVERGKNEKRRLVPLSDGVRRDLVAYDSRRIGLEPAFLRHGRGGRLRQHTAQKWLQRLAARAEIKTPVSVHVLRHTIASHLLAGGLAVEDVRTFLGHALLATTQRYTRVSAEQIEQIVKG
ncbi:MAG: integrase/recombinase XerD [Neolewinella sp.]|jgi:integrase/recombinase XerD